MNTSYSGIYPSNNKQIQESTINRKPTTSKTIIPVNLKGSFLASNHPSQVPQLSSKQQTNMVKDVVKEQKNLTGEYDLEIEEIISPSLCITDGNKDTKEMTQILNKLSVHTQPQTTNQKKKLKKDNRKLNCQKKTGERSLQAEQEREKQEQIVAQQATIKEENMLRNFTLKPVMKGQFKSVVEKDMTKLGEDFRLSTYARREIAKRHMWKRLNFFLVMCSYIEDKAPYLKGYEFPFVAKNQFRATAKVLPSSFQKVTPVDRHFEATHISILNKIVVKDSNKLFTMHGQLTLTAKKIDTTLLHFFNVCDIAHATMNSIDWHAEYYLRSFTYELLDSVKNGEETVSETAQTFAHNYAKCLMRLQDRIRDKNMKADKGCFYKKEFEEQMAKIMGNKETACEYIDGMLEAIIHFRMQSPSFQSIFGIVNKPGYSLYEKMT